MATNKKSNLEENIEKSYPYGNGGMIRDNIKDIGNNMYAFDYSQNNTTNKGTGTGGTSTTATGIGTVGTGTAGANSYTGSFSRANNAPTATYSAFGQSGTSKAADASANNWLSMLNGTVGQNLQNGMISQDTWNTINSKFQQSQTVTDAFSKTNQILDRINSGKSTYGDKIAGLMDQISNRGKFSYDPATDTLFQSALSSAMQSGQTAMQDTMGQAAALSGGYGNSYATSAANQAYNAQIQQAYDNLPEYYNMALSAYQAEGNDLYNQLDMYNAADQSEWSKLLNQYDVNNTNANNAYNREYGQWQDSISNAFNSANMQMSEKNALYDQLSGAYNASQSYADNMYNREFNAWNANEQNSQWAQNFNNSNYWNALNYNQNAEQAEADMKYKYDALNADTQYNYDKIAASTSGSSSGTKATTSSSKKSDTQIDNTVATYFNDDQLSKITEQYIAGGKGDEGINNVINYLEMVGLGDLDSAIYDDLEEWLKRSNKSALSNFVDKIKAPGQAAANLLYNTVNFINKNGGK